MSEAAHEEFADAQPPFDPEMVELLEMLVGALADDLDHPEVWQLLAEFGAMAAAPALAASVDMLRTIQNDRRVRKALDVIGGVLLAVRDKPDGLARLRQMEAAHALCPQVAGACFFASRLGDGTRTADLSERFCADPFTKFETLVDGTVAPCCSIWTKQRLGHLDGQSFEQIWNSEAAQAMRESILDGSFRYCNKQRCTRILEDALPLRSDVADPALRRVIDTGATRLDTRPDWLFLAHDATCNLACPSCRAGIEAASPEQEQRFDTILHEVFDPLLEGGEPIKVSLSGQGDPWSSQHYRAILRRLADNELPAELHLYTNGLLMDPQRWEAFRGLARYRPAITVSIDAATPWVYAYLRRPGRWDRLLPNLRFIAGLRAGGECSEFNLNATIQADNFHEIPVLLALAEELGCDGLWLYMIQNTGAHLAIDYDAKNVADERHPLHLAFLETLRDPGLDRPVVHMYDVGTWREVAFATRLPSDSLAGDAPREDWIAALRGRIEGNAFAEAAALCAAARIRFPGDVPLLEVEAAVLEQLGCGRQAGWRREMAAAAAI